MRLPEMVAHADRPAIAPLVFAALFVLLALVRVVASYGNTAQAFDEPYHIAAAVEFLDKGSYTVDPLHPPLARIAVGIPLYLAGARFPTLPPAESSFASEPAAAALGNVILNNAGNYQHNLMLARIGVLPFLVLGCAVVFLWTRQERGNLAAVLGVALFTTLPIVLAFASIAYTDIVAASTQALACWAVAAWLDKGTWRSAANMGVATGLALAAKATSCLFLPAAALSMLVLKWAVAQRQKKSQPLLSRQSASRLAASGAIAIVIVWAAYGFAFGHVREGMQLSVTSPPSLQHFPAAVRKIGLELIASNPRVPAPALIKGVATVWVMEKSHPAAYLFGRIKQGGWWYFFLVGMGVKTPIPFLILTGVGLFSLKRAAVSGRWTAIAPAACAAAILLVTMPVKINYGVRHVLVVFPLFAIVAGRGCSDLWNWPGNLRGRRRAFGRAALVALLLWQCVSTVRASGDYLAYFNEFAGKDPSKVLVAGCDLDCGQDLFALAHELQQRQVSRVTLALWTSADVAKMGLPAFDVAQPFQPATGWFAISLRALRFGDVFHSTYPPGAFSWLDRYQPVARVGKTILLYHIPIPE